MKILSIDDNPQNRLIIERALKDQFEVVSDDGNSDIRSLVAEHQPAIILLDIMLEGKSGYELCTELRDEIDNESIVVVFVSALHSSEDKLKAYAVGGDDYICKPVDLAELKQKMALLEKRVEASQQLQTQANMATQTAFISMQQAGELGEVINFFTDSVELPTVDKLFLRMKQFFAHFGLNICAEFRANHEIMEYPKEHVTRLESEILQMGRSAKRIVNFGSNILFNSRYCSILVKKLPIEDVDLAGRLRDNFAILLTAVDSRMKYFEMERQKKIEQDKAKAQVAALITADFEELKTVSNEQESKLTKYVEQISIDLETRLLSLGLEESQESEIRGFIDDIKEVIHDSANLSFVIDEKVNNVQQLLKG